jgi:hypothetical protein
MQPDAMQPISDNDLILYFYRDGLDARRIDEIDDALFASAPLRRRYMALKRMLSNVDSDPAIEPDPDFTERMWRKLSTQLDGKPARRIAHRRVAKPMRFAMAASVLLAVAGGIGYYAGRTSAPQPTQNGMASRVLDAYVADHLRATEGLLLTASNSDSSEVLAGNRALAQSLVESNRLYALAAVRAGNTRLADFLRQLEPVLLDLANQPADASVQSIDGLRDYLRRTDLLFEVRATQARLDTDKHKI